MFEEFENLNIIKLVIFIILYVVLLFGDFRYYYHGQLDKNESIEIKEVIGTPLYCALLYKEKNSKWPSSKDELIYFLKNKNNNYDLSLYENLTFSITPKGTLKIHFDSYKRGKVFVGPTDTEY